MSEVLTLQKREDPAGTLWVSFKLIVWLRRLMCSFETLTRPLRVCARVWGWLVVVWWVGEGVRMGGE